MTIRMFLILVTFFGSLTLTAQGYVSDYAVPTLSDQEIRNIIRDRRRLRGQVVELSQTNRRLESYVTDLKNQIAAIQRQSNQTENDRLSLAKLNGKYVNLIAQLRRNVNTLEKLLLAAEKEKEALGITLDELKDEVKAQKQTLAALRAKLEHYKQLATDFEIALLHREAELAFLEQSFSVASVDVFRVQRNKTISVGRNDYKRGLRRKDKIEIHLWVYTFDEELTRARKSKGELRLHLPDGQVKKLRVTFLPARQINRRVQEQENVVQGVSPGYGMLYRMQKEINLANYLDKSDFGKSKSAKISYEVLLPGGGRYFGVLRVRR